MATDLLMFNANKKRRQEIKSISELIQKLKATLIAILKILLFPLSKNHEVRKTKNRKIY